SRHPLIGVIENTPDHFQSSDLRGAGSSLGLGRFGRDFTFLGRLGRLGGLFISFLCVGGLVLLILFAFLLFVLAFLFVLLLLFRLVDLFIVLLATLGRVEVGAHFLAIQDLSSHEKISSPLRWRIEQPIASFFQSRDIKLPLPRRSCKATEGISI